MDNWSPPDCPLPLPETQKYDAASLFPARPSDGAATRETATCPACVATRRKKRQGMTHCLVWGECLRAPPPPLQPAAGVPAVVADEDRVDEPDEQTAEPNVIVHDDGEWLAVAANTRMINVSPVQRSLEHPHACITLSDAATWGSADPSEITETDVPPTDNDDDVLTLVDENQSDEEFFIDDEWVVHGGSTAPM